MLSAEGLQRIHTCSQPASSLRPAQNQTNRAQGSDLFFLLCFFFNERVSDGKERSGSLASKPIPQRAPGIIVRRPLLAPLCSALIHQGEGLMFRLLAQGQALPHGTSGLLSKVILVPRERETGWLARPWPRANRPLWGCASSLVISSPDPARPWSPGPSVRSSVSILCHLAPSSSLPPYSQGPFLFTLPNPTPPQALDTFLFVIVPWPSLPSPPLLFFGPPWPPPLHASVRAFGSDSGSGSGSVQDPGIPESCRSLWRSCCRLWNRCSCPGPGTGSSVGYRGARLLLQQETEGHSGNNYSGSAGGASDTI